MSEEIRSPRASRKSSDASKKTGQDSLGSSFRKKIKFNARSTLQRAAKSIMANNKGNAHCENVCRLLRIKQADRTASDTSALLSNLSKLPFFSELPLHAVEELLTTVKYQRIEKSSVLLRQGMEGDTLLVLISGSLNILRQVELSSGSGKGGKETHGHITYRAIDLPLQAYDPEDNKLGHMVSQIHAPEAVGDLAMLRQGVKRTATVACTAPVDLILIDKVSFDRMRKKYGNILYLPERYLDVFHKNETDRSADDSALMESILLSLRIFQALPVDVLRSIIPKLYTEVYKPGQNIFQHGDEANKLYLLIKGSVNLYDPHDVSNLKQAVELGVLEPPPDYDTLVANWEAQAHSLPSDQHPPRIHQRSSVQLELAVVNQAMAKASASKMVRAHILCGVRD
ncbi:hypothetical protein CYMTET_52003 [Cymbomonas tetramitiformis]|uniref:Cyclic nucleotide-binding domain-containing protein n=1 Tax=Cymbomonas tetramitiformis TaxID=36881 RepID=A0AAE0ES29_9CHLO|nr:hypothetical protein CYMTET_52003 [Cymbomonas tetramitiformis]